MNAEEAGFAQGWLDAVSAAWAQSLPHTLAMGFPPTDDITQWGVRTEVLPPDPLLSGMHSRVTRMEFFARLYDGTEITSPWGGAGGDRG